MKRFISGVEIRERHQWLPFEFVAVMESRELVPIDPEAEELVRLTEDVNPCLYCNGDRNAQECGRGEVIFTTWDDAMRELSVRVCKRQFSKTTTTRAQELDAAIFFFSEVLDYEKTHGLKSDDATLPSTTYGPEVAPPENPVHVQTGKCETPKEEAEQMLAEGRDPGEVMLALISRNKKMPQWKAAALALRLSVVDLDQFEKDRLKGKFQRRTKVYR